MNSQQMNEKNASEQMRVVRGYAIISKGDVPKQIDAKTFSIASQNGNGEYNIIVGKKWLCSCPDFAGRKMDCKHIHAVRFFLDFKNKVKTENKGIVAEKLSCPYCSSQDTIGYGKRHTQSGQKQIHKCRQCNKKFIEEKDFERYKGNGKITTMILDLYFKGISLRGIKDHLQQFHSLPLDHSNILRRIQKFSGVIDNYVKTLKPEVADIWHHDEMKIQAGGKWRWLWNIMDEETKFLITTQVSTKTRLKETRAIFEAAREQAGIEPTFLITDGRYSYTRSIKKELPTTQHVRLVTIADKRANNQNIERLNGTIRDRVTPMRGFHSEATAELMTSAFRNYYNFIKPHSTLEGKTPAQMAGIGVEGHGNKWMALLNLSLKSKKGVIPEIIETC
ncbi:IS1/IS6 family transposase [Candidatus Woesearchaeota archaeon]|nr:IS1/IS6 family transposase [Candidatus Woesearchaeota archaeon]